MLTECSLAGLAQLCLRISSHTLLRTTKAIIRVEFSYSQTPQLPLLSTVWDIIREKHCRVLSNLKAIPLTTKANSPY